MVTNFFKNRLFPASISLYFRLLNRYVHLNNAIWLVNTCDMTWIAMPIFFLKNGPTPASYSFIFVFSNKHYNFLQQINVKIVLPVYGARIRTHNLQNMSLLPWPLDQGSCTRDKKITLLWNF